MAAALLCLLLAALAGVGTAWPAAAGSAARLRLQVEADAAGVGQNLVPNPSFEEVAQGRPVGWSWDRRNTDATFALVNDAHSGRHAVRITNGTPTSPHVFGQMVLAGGVRLTPGQTYTLSLYAKSRDPGIAWVGGGEGWWMRLLLSGTGGKWRRFTQTFVARESVFPLMVNTDGPTTGFLVDDIKLEQGDHPTPFLDALETRPVELVLEAPTVLSVPGAEATLRAFIHVGEGASPGPARVTLSPAGGKPLTATTRALPPGLSRLQISWTPGARPAQHWQVTVKVGNRTEQASLQLYTAASYQAAEREARAAIAALQATKARAAARGVPTNYARAARVIAQRFLGVAARKRDADLLPAATADAQFLAALCREQDATLRATLAGKQPRREVPNPSLTGLRLGDGCFWAGDEPVMLVGALGYDELERELDTYRDYGFNVIGDDFNAFSAFQMLRGEEQWDETALPRLAANWDRLRQLNLVAAYNPTLHYFPEWALTRYPDITGGDPVDRLPDWSGLNRHAGQRVKTYGGFFPFAIDSPNLRRLVSRYYGKLMPELAKHSLFHVIWLMNEPTYRSTDPHYLELFRAYLRRKFPDIAALNAAWGTQHPSFDAIGYPAQAGSPAKWDWLTFHQDQVASWFEWLAAEIKQHHPRALLSNKPMAWTLLHPEEGIDWEREAELWEIPGCDASRSPDTSTYAFGWVEAAMLFDFQKSVAPEKPLADHEYHYVHSPNLSSEYVRATYFHSYLHGLRMSQFWVWSTGQIGPGAAGAGMDHTAWSQPRVAWGTATAALDLRRLARYIAAFPGRPKVRLYYSRPSLYLDHATHTGGILHAYQAANGLDAPVGFITDRMIRAGKLDGCELLIVPAATHVERNVRAAIEAYARAGGHVALLGESLSRDEYGRPHPTPLALPDDRTVRLEKVDRDALVPALEQAYQWAGVSRPVRALTPQGRPAWPVECRVAVVDGRRVCAIVGLNREPVTVRLEAQPPVRGWEDLITGRRGKGRTLTVKPLDVSLLRLEP
ncbi:MAG: hypothetical protein GX774_13290 [Armatimonadetes bacterium]|nr:hypothetical protein [Armatimonadota bacterium]